MGFSSKQLLALRGDVDAAHTRLRKLKDGRELPYIEGWYAISEANRIFGFDAWSRETLDVKCLQAREVRGLHQVLYLAKVRLTVRAGEHETIREGYGTGGGSSEALGEAHEKALKTAETDATKRALATFGRPFGLALHVPAGETGLTHPPIPEAHRRRTRQRKGPDGRYRLVRDPRLSLLPSQVFTLPDGPEKAPEPPAEAGGGVEQPLGETAVSDQPQAEAVPEESNQVVPITRPIRRRSKHHLRHVMGQPCLICARTPSDAHHLRFAQPRAMGRKVSDEYTVPLCRTHHRQLHHSGDEIAWWIAVEIDPLPIALDLWNESQGRAGPAQSGAW